MFRIVSNKSLLVCYGGEKNIKTYNMDLEFNGTLIDIFRNRVMPSQKIIFTYLYLQHSGKAL